MSFFSELLKPKSHSVIGVDIGSSSLKVVQLRREKGRALLETYGELALGPYGGVEVGQATNLSAEQITETLKDLLREAKVTTTDAALSIPYARSLLTLVELPRREDPAEQKTIIELEARKYIPVPITEVQLDWFIVPDGSDAAATRTDKVRVLLVAVHTDELKLLQSIVQGAALSASFFELEIFSTIRAVVQEPTKAVLVLDIGASTTKAYIVERGVIAQSHAITVGGQDVTRTLSVAKSLPFAHAEATKKKEGVRATAGDAAELVFTRIFDEARRMLLQFETGHQKPVSGIVLTGGGGVTRNLGEFARSFFSIDVQVADPFARTDAPAFMRSVLQEIGPEFSVAVGLALRKLEERH